MAAEAEKAPQGSTFIDVVAALNALEDRKAKLVTSISEHERQRIDYTTQLNQKSCYYRKTKLSPKKWTINGLVAEKKNLKEYDPIRKSNGDCGWMKDKIWELQNTLRDEKSVLEVTEKQLIIAREGAKQTGAAQQVAYNAVQTLENANATRADNQGKLIKQFVFVAVVAIAIYGIYVVLTKN